MADSENLWSLDQIKKPSDQVTAKSILETQVNIFNKAFAGKLDAKIISEAGYLNGQEVTVYELLVRVPELNNYKVILVRLMQPGIYLYPVAIYNVISENMHENIIDQNELRIVLKKVFASKDITDALSSLIAQID